MRRFYAHHVGKHAAIKIEAWNLDFDGEYVGWCAKTLTVSPFGGARSYIAQSTPGHVHGQERRRSN